MERLFRILLQLIPEIRVERAYRILDINRAVLERCARELLARETLDESDIRQLTQGLVRN